MLMLASPVLALLASLPVVEEYEWVMLATGASGAPVIAAAKPIVEGTSYGHCYIRLVRKGDEVLEWSCPGTLACSAGCAAQSRDFPDYLLVWCDCGASK